MNTKQAIDYLSKDPVLHMDMIASIRNGDAELLYASAHGTLLFNTACKAIMMSAQDESTAGRMLDLCNEKPLFVAHQSFYIEKVQEKYAYPVKMACRQAVYLRKESLPYPESPVVIRQLDERHLPFIMEHYSHADDEEYHRERLRSGAMFGAFLGESLTGFIGIHSEGSIGMIEVLPQYRRHGIALSLESFLVNRLLTQNKVPFAQIISDNTASVDLHRKLHFKISEDTVFWLCKK